MAIVGLTLMVVFALVHSLPYEGLEPTPEVEIVPSTPPPREKVAQAEPDPNLVTVPREELERMAQSDAELRDTRRRLADTLAERNAFKKEVEALEGRVSAVTTELSRTRRELEAELRETALDVAGAGAQEAAAAWPAEPDTLVLRFRNDRVYLDLLEDSKIRSYLRIPELDLTYEVSREAPERLQFSLVYGHADDAVYEIPDRTIPDVLRDETRRFDLRLSLRNDLDYLVVLSETIHDQIEQLEAAGKVGFYDILASERVVPAGNP